MSSNPSPRPGDSEEQLRIKRVEYTSDPWRIIERLPNSAWAIVGESAETGVRELATIPNAVNDRVQQANARLIAQAPAMHRAAVRLLTVWGTEDAAEAVEELAKIVAQAVKTKASER